MAHGAVMAAFETKLAADWPTLCAGVSLSVVPTIFWPNQPTQVPNNGAAFLSVEYIVANEEMKSAGVPGGNIWREEGVALFTLSIPIGDRLTASATPWAALLDALRADFRGKTLTVGSGFMTVFEASPAAFRGQSDNGAYGELSTAIAYWFDIVG